MKAAALSVDITPPPNAWLTGYGARLQRAIGVHDPLEAGIVVLDDGETRAALVGLDLCGIAANSVARIRVRVGGWGQNALFCCSHTHAGPHAMPWAMRGEIDPQYLERLEESVARGLLRAAEELAPARLTLAETSAVFAAYNRTAPAGPVDTSLTCLTFEGANGCIATVVRCAVHAVMLGSDNRWLSADYPGPLKRAVEARTAAPCIFLQGASGDVNPLVCGDRRHADSFA